MQRNDYLDPESMKAQCDKAIRKLEKDNRALEAAWKSVRNFSEDEEIRSDAFADLKKQLNNYQIVIEAMKISNSSAIKDFQRLKTSVGDEVLDGENIFSQMESVQEVMHCYQSEEDRLRGRMLASKEPFTYLYYNRKAEKYSALAASSQRLYETWTEKTERFDEIVSNTSGLFTDSEGICVHIKRGLSGIAEAFLDGTYVPDRESGWQIQVINAGLRLAMCFDDCGGRQEGPGTAWWTGLDDERDYIRKVIHSYEEYADYSDEEITGFLKKLNSEGCGYVAFANIIVDEYRGKEEEFEKAFGFPLFSENPAGKSYVNYNRLILDLYCASDNHNEEGGLWWKRDQYDDKEDYSETEGIGTTQENRIYRFERYMKAHDIEVKMENITCSEKEVYKRCKEEADKGNRVIISTHPVKLEDERGREAQADGGHAMTVTGLTDDGRIEVSSWGKRYYIMPEDPDYREGCPEEGCGADAYIRIQSVRFC